MSVYLGNEGGLAIRRQGEPVVVVLEVEDVSVEFQRLSFDFDPTFPETRPNVLITGDSVQFATVDGSTFELVDGVVATDVTRWVHVDQTGGIRLYDSYELAINGGQDNAEVLVQPTQAIEITVDVVNIQYECVAQMRSWEMTTQRDTVSTDILGEEFRQFYDQGLISGQGQITAIWDYKYSPCVDDFNSGAELANYFAQLVIRFREGARFCGMFTVYRDDREAVWYEADCICTSVGMNFAPGAVIDSNIQFVTTGQIRLLRGQAPAYLLLESGDEIELEQPPGNIELEFDE